MFSAPPPPLSITIQPPTFEVAPRALSLPSRFFCNVNGVLFSRRSLITEIKRIESKEINGSASEKKETDRNQEQWTPVEIE